MSMLVAAGALREANRKPEVRKEKEEEAEEGKLAFHW